ncbi:MAG: citrate/2-methylcitrate synthase, partial [Caldilineaceae bacterium]
MTQPIVAPGLEGIIAGSTRLSRVNGLAGELIIAGYPLEAIAANATFEETTYLLWNDRLPNAAELAELQASLA